MNRAIALAGALALALTTVTLPAQSRQRDSRFGLSQEDWCRSERRSDHCEVREDTLGGLSAVDVDATPNGGIAVRGWDRNDVRVRTKVTAYADTDAAASALAASVRVLTDGGRIRAEGPQNGRDEYWTASFELEVPRTGRVALTARNGGISIADFRGYSRFESTNGGIALRDVGGDLRGETVNGGVSIELSGSRWDGAGLDVETRNGGVRLSLPRNYSAELDLGTANGGLDLDFPIVVQGQLTRLNRHITTTIGSGGPRLRLSTVNGGVRVSRQ